ncbi:MAG: O-antigen ligase family protein [bacterium]|nr:O-antigen ligase family protein [bacterium]
MGNSWINQATEYLSDRVKFASNGQLLLRLYCLSAAISIGLSQLLVITLLLHWLSFLYFQPRCERYRFLPALSDMIVLSCLSWSAISFGSVFWGVDSLHALPEFFKTSVYLLFPFAVFSVLQATDDTITVRQQIRNCVMLLLLGQGVASLHSIFSEIAGVELRPGLPGAVTESGQLVLVLPLILSAFQEKARPYRELAVPAAIIVVSLALSYGSGGSGIFLLLKLLIASIFGFFLVFYMRSLTKTQRIVAIQQILAGLLIAALIINLKRGPWLAVFVEFCLLSFLLSRRIFLATVAMSLIAFVCLIPVQQRLFDSSSHFQIAGGRETMWTLGAELVQRYPLGLGPDNASYMRELDPNLPRLHRHMHNNFLNIAVENGWLGLFAFCWWIYACIAMGCRAWGESRRASRASAERSLGLYAICLATALMGWQIAGVVEYNFGDGEIRLIAFLFMGFILWIGTFFSGRHQRSEELLSDN